MKKFFQLIQKSISLRGDKEGKSKIQFLFTSSGDVEIIANDNANDWFFAGIMPKKSFDEMIEKYKQGK